MRLLLILTLLSVNAFSISTGSYTVCHSGNCDYDSLQLVSDDIENLTGDLDIQVLDYVHTMTRNFSVTENMNGYNITVRGLKDIYGNPRIGTKLVTNFNAQAFALQMNADGITDTFEIKDFYWRADGAFNINKGMVKISNITTSPLYYLHDMLWDGNGGNGGVQLWVNDADAVVEAFNIVGWDGGSNTATVYIENCNAASIFENITSFDMPFGIYLNSKNATVQNCMVLSATTNAYQSIGNATGNNNIGSDASGGDGNWNSGSGNITGKVASTCIIDSTDTNKDFMNVLLYGYAHDAGITNLIAGRDTCIRNNPIVGTPSIGAAESPVIDSLNVPIADVLDSFPLCTLAYWFEPTNNSDGDLYDINGSEDTLYDSSLFSINSNAGWFAGDNAVSDGSGVGYITNTNGLPLIEGKRFFNFAWSISYPDWSGTEVFLAYNESVSGNRVLVYSIDDTILVVCGGSGGGGTDFTIKKQIDVTHPSLPENGFVCAVSIDMEDKSNTTSWDLVIGGFDAKQSENGPSAIVSGHSTKADLIPDNPGARWVVGSISGGSFSMSNTKTIDDLVFFVGRKMTFYELQSLCFNLQNSVYMITLGQSNTYVYSNYPPYDVKDSTLFTINRVNGRTIGLNYNDAINGVKSSPGPWPLVMDSLSSLLAVNGRNRIVTNILGPSGNKGFISGTGPYPGSYADSLYWLRRETQLVTSDASDFTKGNYIKFSSLNIDRIDSIQADTIWGYMLERRGTSPFPINGDIMTEYTDAACTNPTGIVSILSAFGPATQLYNKLLGNSKMIKAPIKMVFNNCQNDMKGTAASNLTPLYNAINTIHHSWFEVDLGYNVDFFLPITASVPTVEIDDSLTVYNNRLTHYNYVERNSDAFLYCNDLDTYFDNELWVYCDSAEATTLEDTLILIGQTSGVKAYVQTGLRDPRGTWGMATRNIQGYNECFTFGEEATVANDTAGTSPVDTITIDSCRIRGFTVPGIHYSYVEQGDERPKEKMKFLRKYLGFEPTYTLPEVFVDSYDADTVKKITFETHDGDTVGTTSGAYTWGWRGQNSEGIWIPVKSASKSHTDTVRLVFDSLVTEVRYQYSYQDGYEYNGDLFYTSQVIKDSVLYHIGDNIPVVPIMQLLAGGRFNVGIGISNHVGPSDIGIGIGIEP